MSRRGSKEFFKMLERIRKPSPTLLGYRVVAIFEDEWGRREAKYLTLDACHQFVVDYARAELQKEKADWNKPISLLN